MKNKLKAIISKEKFCLHFDGKRIEGKEYQVVCLKNELRTLRLGILICESGKGKDIHKELKKLIDEYDAWNAIVMIVSDTTAVNTGHTEGVVTRLKEDYVGKNLIEPQFIGCQHHILDTILRHVLDMFFPTVSVGPNLNYKFIEEVSKSYEDLKNRYPGTDMVPKYENLGWRDDFKFLFNLCEAYKFYKADGKWPLIEWQKLPSLHRARWNSRGIYALIAYFLLPKRRQKLTPACDFIANNWSKAWFSSQKYSEMAYNELSEAITEINCHKALTSLSNFWNKDPSLLDVPRTNIVAERGVKLMEYICKESKSDKYLNSKFINSNTELDNVI